MFTRIVALFGLSFAFVVGTIAVAERVTVAQAPAPPRPASRRRKPPPPPGDAGAATPKPPRRRRPRRRRTAAARGHRAARRRRRRSSPCRRRCRRRSRRSRKDKKDVVPAKTSVRGQAAADLGQGHGDRLLPARLSARRRRAAGHRTDLAGDAPVAQPQLGPPQPGQIPGKIRAARRQGHRLERHPGRRHGAAARRPAAVRTY